MSVKILITRTMEPEKAKEMVQLFKKLRSLAVAQPGYISGETLKSADRPNVYLVISSWQSAEDWEQWLLNKERQEIQGVIDSLLGGNTHYELFHYGFND